MNVRKYERRVAYAVLCRHAAAAEAEARGGRRLGAPTLVAYAVAAIAARCVMVGGGGCMVRGRSVTVGDHGLCVYGGHILYFW